jgi:KUP system potassium uptake protein
MAMAVDAGDGTGRSLNEAAHKLTESPRDGDGAMRRPLNEAAHKLTTVPAQPKPRKKVRSLYEQDADRDVVAHAGRLVLALGALGIVFGDLGTSPLYAEQNVFLAHKDAAHATPAGVYGVASLIFWALTIIVSIKYAGVIMRAHNKGDGGAMALAALIQRRRVPHWSLLIVLGIFGAGLFFGDGMITPAISVMSAVEGLKVATPTLAHAVVPISLAILAALFAIQRKGTGAVGWLFGPVILLWFVTIGVLGAREVVAHPGVLQGLSPTYAVSFMVDHGVAAFLTLGAVVLAVTGAEALYADRGHFGVTPIRIAWFGVVFPAVMLSYLGQAALILAHPHSITNPFYLLVPSGGRLAMVFLATAATIIASQAAITGSYSMARQAVQLGLLPRLKIRHTSHTEGQIYVPLVTLGLAIGVGTLVLAFRNSASLAHIYGVAVSGTFILDTILFIAVARSMWHTRKWKLALLAALFLIVELSFFSSNLTKIAHGAWLPLTIGLLASVVMITWRRGRVIVTRNRDAEEGPLLPFLDGLAQMDPPIHRVERVAVYLNPGKLTTPLALRADVEHHGALHRKVLIVSIEPVSVPHVDDSEKFEVEHLGTGLFKVIHITIRAGYRDSSNVPELLALARKRGFLERALDLEHASYFVSRITITATPDPGMRRWRKLMFIAMARNATSPIEAFGLPVDRTVAVSSQVAL